MEIGVANHFENINCEVEEMDESKEGIYKEWLNTDSIANLEVQRAYKNSLEEKFKKLYNEDIEVYHNRMLNSQFLYQQATYFVPKIQSQVGSANKERRENMRRNHEIKVRLNDDEFNDLNRKVIKSKLSREEYIRRCFSKSLIKEPPNLDYFRLKNEFNHIGNNLNQIAKSLNTYEQVDIHFIEITVNELRNMIKNLEQEVRGV